MDRVSVVGLGPGDKAYILPACKEAIKKADILIGASRHLKALGTYGKQTFLIEHRFSEMLDFIKTNAPKRRITVVVSGDTGFYSLLRYLKGNLTGIQFDVMPGLSAMSLMFARLGFMYDDAYTGSVHGKALDIAALVRVHKKVGLLTDSQTTPSEIAKTLINARITGKIIAIGERLSYPDERIRKLTLAEAAECSTDPLSVVVIYDEDVYI